MGREKQKKEAIMLDNTSQMELILEIFSKCTKYNKTDAKGRIECTVIISTKTMKEVWNTIKIPNNVLGDKEPVKDTEKQDWNSDLHEEIKQLRAELNKLKKGGE
jgi:hypothetical protein